MNRKSIAVTAAAAISFGLPLAGVAAQPAAAAPAATSGTISLEQMPVVRKGSTGDAVKSLQATLTERHGAKLDVDGQFGQATHDAVVSFQKAKGLDADGVVGRQTWAALMGQPGKQPPKKGGGNGGSASAGRNTENPETAPGIENGQVPETHLCTVPFDPEQHKVACYMVDQLVKMNEAYKAEFGQDIDITSDDDTAYRTLEQQQALWNARQEDPDNNAPAAVPGESNHGWGLAIDLADVDYGTDKYNWLNTHGPEFGFDDDVEEEAWHWHYVA